MIGFVMVGTNDLNKSIKFYDILLESLDLKRTVTNEKYAGYSSKQKSEDIEFRNKYNVTSDKELPSISRFDPVSLAIFIIFVDPKASFAYF